MFILISLFIGVHFPSFAVPGSGKKIHSSVEQLRQVQERAEVVQERAEVVKLFHRLFTNPDMKPDYAVLQKLMKNAIKIKNIEMIDSLLEHSPQLAEDPEVFLYACDMVQGNTIVITKLLENGANVNASDEYGSCLHNVIRASSTPSFLHKTVESTLDTLIEEKGANPMILDQYGKDPFLKACQDGIVPAVRYFVENITGIDINKADNYGEVCILHIAENDRIRRDPRKYVDTVNFLLDHGADPNLTNEDGISASSVLAEYLQGRMFDEIDD